MDFTYQEKELHGKETLQIQKLLKTLIDSFIRNINSSAAILTWIIKEKVIRGGYE